MKNNLSLTMIPKSLVTLFLIALTAITIPAVLEFGVLGILKVAFSSTATIQVWFDLFIALMIFMILIWHDVKRNVKVFCIWFIITLIIGSYGPLLYLLLRKKEV